MQNGDEATPLSHEGGLKDELGAEVNLAVALLVGFNTVGKKLAFLDLIPWPSVDVDPALAGETQSTEVSPAPLAAAPTTGAPVEGPVIHLAGDHVRRDVPLSFNHLIQPSTPVYCFCVAQREDSLSSSEYGAFMESLTLDGRARVSVGRTAISLGLSEGGVVPPCPLTAAASVGKLRIGDIFTARGLVTNQAKAQNGHLVTNVRANAIQLLRSGAVSRPGDHAVKWRTMKLNDAAVETSGGKTAAPPVEEARPARVKEGHPRRHKHRFRVFAEFCATNLFPSPTVKNQPRRIVLDVAGGSGLLSFAFRNLSNDFEPWIVDPRGAPKLPTKKLKDAERKLRRKRNRAQQANGSSSSSDDDSEAEGVEPNAGGGDVANVTGTSTRRAPEELVAIYQTPVPAIPALFDCSDPKQQSMIEQCAAIVGLHCDGAVNEIIKAACTFGKPFCICACCVFPNQYSRTLLDGTPVVERHELNQWIVEELERQKYPGKVQTATLGFPGANVCVWGVPTELKK